MRQHPLILGILSGYIDHNDLARYVVALGGTYVHEGKRVRGYGIAINGWVREVIPESAEAMEQAYRRVEFFAKHYSTPHRVSEVYSFNTGQIAVKTVASHASVIH